MGVLVAESSRVIMQSIKFKYEGEVRRISAPTSVSYEELMSTVYDLFGFDLPSFSLKYTDEDGDLITMKSELDLSEAMQLFQGRCLILHVMKNGQASAPTVCEAKPTEEPSATPQPATPQSDFERIAGDIKAQFERAFAGSSTATPAPAPAAPGVNVLQMLMQQFAGAQQSAPAAPASPFSGILNQVENAVLLAQIASFI